MNQSQPGENPASEGELQQTQGPRGVADPTQNVGRPVPSTPLSVVREPPTLEDAPGSHLDNAHAMRHMQDTNESRYTADSTRKVVEAATSFSG